MDTIERNVQVTDYGITQLLDNILDAVLALKAHLKDSNMDLNSIGGAKCSVLNPQYLIIPASVLSFPELHLIYSLLSLF